MSDFRDATFIPQQPPHEAVLDYSHTLSATAISTLQTQATAMQQLQRPIKAKAVILPSDFHVNDFPQFANDLGQQWHVGGSRLLTIVDMKDHKVQILSGRDLANAGLNHDAITNQIVPQNFVPYMKKGDLQGAISNSWDAARSVVQQGQVATSTAAPRTYSYGERVPRSQEQPPNMINLMAPFIIIGVVLVGLWMLSVKQRKDQNAKLVEQFRNSVGPLYELADQIGAASEYLSPKTHADLAQRVATFFNRLTAFEQAQKEAEHLSKGGQIYKVRDAYLNLVRMIDLLMPEASALKDDVNAVTGGVETYKPDRTPSLTQQAADAAAKENATADGGAYIKVPDRLYQSDNWRRPSWSYQPAYYQSYDSGGTIGGLASMMLVLNEMQMLNMAARGPHYDNYLGGGFGTGGGGFFGGGSSDSGSSGWDSGGGGWDSGGSSFDSGGGDWGGGGGDSGGGGGGGDW